MTLGERIKQLRKQNGLTQVDLANQLDVTKGTVSTWETNSRKPNFETLEQICEMFRVSMDYLMGRSDDATPLMISGDELESLALSSVEEDLTEYALKYARLDQYGRDAVESIIRAEYSRCRAEDTLTEPTSYSVSVHINLQK
jgi:transcriptional regulator with XRE-family HTH domain